MLAVLQKLSHLDHPSLQTKFTSGIQLTCEVDVEVALLVRPAVDGHALALQQYGVQQSQHRVSRVGSGSAGAATGRLSPGYSPAGGHPAEG